MHCESSGRDASPSTSGSEPQAIRSVILITATTLPSLNACSFVFFAQVQTWFFFAVKVLPSCTSRSSPSPKASRPEVPVERHNAPCATRTGMGRLPPSSSVVDHRGPICYPCSRHAPPLRLDSGNDYRPYHRRNRGSGRRPCESYDGVGASRWPCPDRERACLCSANHASNRQHPSHEADRGGLAPGGPQWPASLFPACPAHSGRQDPTERRRPSSEETAIPSAIGSSTRA